MMHWFMINYCFDNGYDRYNFYGLSGDFMKTVKIMAYTALNVDLMYKSKN